jgi:hypothetical protein
MKHAILACLLGTTSLPAGTLILSDNFNAADNTNFDNSDQTGRRSGLLRDQVQLRSSRIQHGILANELNILKPPTGSGRIRFQEVASLPTNVWTNFAAGSSGTTILAEGGLRIAFDWLPANTTDGNWISLSTGIAGIGTAEPDIRVNQAATDFGILFRNNGQTQYFDNGAAVVGTSFPVPSVAVRKVVITMAFDSFADGSLVTARATVDGTSVLPDGFTFQWDGNLGSLYMEFGNYAAGTKIDNYTISGLNGLTISSTSPPFYSSILNGGLAATFSTTDNEVEEAATYSLVSGDGDADNSKFKIMGNRLESNGFDFQSLPDGTPLSARVRSTATSSGLSTEVIVLLTVIADSDSDDLPDAWELAITGNGGIPNLTDLKGRNPLAGPGTGTGNFDGDTLTDLQEYDLTRNRFPALSPLLADTDSDTLEDGSEITPTGTRLATDPTRADSDGDGLSDALEDNSGSFVSATIPGTSPLSYDTDNDGFPDGYEVQRGTIPLDSGASPALPAPLTAVALTTDESSGISSANLYTHTISGGYPATINGVVFSALKPAQTVAEFSWATLTNTGTAANFNEIAALNLGEWVPANGNVTGAGLQELFGGFVYSGNGDRPGSVQTYSLTGLTPGEKYELRIYNRVWSKVGSGRPISLTLINGASSTNAYILQDRPGIMLGNGIPDTAYALIYPYTAETSELTITAAIPTSTLPISGSMHLYGLTNQVASDTSFKITDIALQSNPTAAVLTFESVPGAVYAVDASTAMNAVGQPGGWTELTDNLASNGATTTYTDSSIAGTVTRLFYRVRRLR